MVRGSSVLWLAAAAFLFPAAAQATNKAVEQRWAAMDRCTAEAVAAYPESTRQSLAKRDTAMRDCQRRNHVPIRDRLVPRVPSSQEPLQMPLR